MVTKGCLFGPSLPLAFTFFLIRLTLIRPGAQRRETPRPTILIWGFISRFVLPDNGRKVMEADSLECVLRRRADRVGLTQKPVGLLLPEAVMNLALDDDGELAMAGNFQRRVGDVSTLGFCGGHGGVDIIDQEVRADDGGFGFVHRRTHADGAAVGELGGAGIAEFGNSVTEGHLVNLRVSRAGGVDVGGNDFEVVDLHGGRVFFKAKTRRRVKTERV